MLLPMVLFWGMAVGVLNPTESKKWLGLIGAAGTCGCILAGYTISFVSKQEYVNELSLCMVAGVLLVVSFILVVRAKLLTIDDDEGTPSADLNVAKIGPNLSNFGSRRFLGATTRRNTMENLKTWIKNSGKIKPGSRMMSFEHLSDQELDDVAAYIQYSTAKKAVKTA